MKAPHPGSSPLARGTHEADMAVLNAFRLIPARAGNTWMTWRCYGTRPAHPRSRGEHSPFTVISTSRIGSSPLARGTHRKYHIAAREHRLIPARAGNTGVRDFGHYRPAAHPRSRGEHGMVAVGGMSRLGSSPLARGTLLAEITRRPNERLIPARAGNT